MKGQKHLVFGNHDKAIRKNKDFVNLFESVSDLLTVKVQANVKFLYCSRYVSADNSFGADSDLKNEPTPSPEKNFLLKLSRSPIFSFVALFRIKQ